MDEFYRLRATTSRPSDLRASGPFQGQRTARLANRINDR
jgi:hypothetical protein